MQGVLEIAEVAALVGDPTRANILCALLDGRALTASELAYSAGVSPQTTSGHLAKLTNGKLLGLVKQGRHHYYRLAGPHIGRMLESIMDVAVTGPPRYRPRSSREEQLRIVDPKTLLITNPSSASRIAGCTASRNGRVP